jgi:hypothetical protein
MLRHNLTAKILVAVGVTVAVVIAIYTHFVIRVQSDWWHERIVVQNFISASMVQEYLSGVGKNHLGFNVTSIGPHEPRSSEDNHEVADNEKKESPPNAAT